MIYKGNSSYTYLYYIYIYILYWGYWHYAPHHKQEILSTWFFYIAGLSSKTTLCRKKLQNIHGTNKNVVTVWVQLKGTWEYVCNLILFCLHVNWQCWKKTKHKLSKHMRGWIQRVDRCPDPPPPPEICRGCQLDMRVGSKVVFISLFSISWFASLTSVIQRVDAEKS